jgi:hypothetical protein
MTATAADRDGHPNLAAWLQDCEAKWQKHATRNADGHPKMKLVVSLDHLGKLSKQFPFPPTRIVYTRSGTLLAAAVVEDSSLLIDFSLYWAPARSRAEARYLAGILNSEALRQRIASRQSRGQWGARDFASVMWELPIPEYDAHDPLHRDLVTLAAEAERAAAAVKLEPEGRYFTYYRSLVRDALATAGISARLDALVARIPGL